MQRRCTPEAARSVRPLSIAPDTATARATARAFDAQFFHAAAPACAYPCSPPTRAVSGRPTHRRALRLRQRSCAVAAHCLCCRLSRARSRAGGAPADRSPNVTGRGRCGAESYRAETRPDVRRSRSSRPDRHLQLPARIFATKFDSFFYSCESQDFSVRNFAFLTAATPDAVLVEERGLPGDRSF